MPNPTPRTILACSARILFGIAIVMALAWLGRRTGLGSPWFALTTAICLLGLLDLLRFFWDLPLPRFLRRPRPWELHGRAYRALGVSVFGVLLRRTPLRWLNRRVYVPASRDLMAVAHELEGAEAAHFWAAVAVSMYLPIAVARTWTTTLVLLSVFNVIGNVYPILHLRWARARVEKLASRHASPAPRVTRP